MIKYHNPVAETNREISPYDLGIKLTGNNQATVGLLANGFPDSVNFLDQIGQVLQEQHPGLKLKFYDKGNASIPANDEILDDISLHCNVVVAAYGH